MPKYKKKPVVIEAFRIGIDPRPDWFQDKVTNNEITTYNVSEKKQKVSPFEYRKTYCKIKTLEGEMVGNYGDYIVKGVNDEVYPVQPGIFNQTYTKLEGEE